MREKGKGHQETMYKGHMDKAKGEGRIKGGRWGWLGLWEWWGENGDNST